MKYASSLFCTLLVVGGCAARRNITQPATVVDLQVRMAQIKFKQFMVNLSMAASAGIKRGLEADEQVKSADVYIDYELPARALAAEPACMPVLVELTWNDSKAAHKNAGELVQKAFRNAEMDVPAITKVLSNDECTVVEGYLLIQSTPDKSGIRNLTPLSMVGSEKLP